MFICLKLKCLCSLIEVVLVGLLIIVIICW